MTKTEAERNGEAEVLSGAIPLRVSGSQSLRGRCALVGRWARFTLRSLRDGYWDFALQGMRGLGLLPLMSALDLVGSKRVMCNICGWSGAQFYPNIGPGYDERDILCPGCRCLDRHRALVAVLAGKTRFFAPESRVIEVAPMRGFQRFCLAQKSCQYISFDLERFAIEQGDITKMRYADASADYFLAFHVLEHIPEEITAMSEIRRVLKPGGTGVFQVPVDHGVDHTFEYEKPDPREVGHVRRYGRDFGERLAKFGFDVQAVSVKDFVEPSAIERYRLSTEPIYLARKPCDC